MPDYILSTSPQMKRRHAAEKRFKWYGRGAIALALAFLVVMFSAIIYRGAGAFSQTQVNLDITFSEQRIDPQGTRDPENLALANYKPLVTDALAEIFPNVTERREKQKLYALLSSSAVFLLSEKVVQDPSLIGTTQSVLLPLSSDIDLYVKGKINVEDSEDVRVVKDQEIAWIKTLQSQGLVEKHFNKNFFTRGDSTDPVMAGILGAAIGSFFTLLTCFIIAFPLGILTAVYLEEYAKKNRWTDFIEVNINNLAAVPSIVFGLLGLAILLNFFGLPRSTPLVGGIVLALMAMPTIIIASRSILRSIPQSIRDAALGLGASKTQTTFHHVVPLAMPGMLTGTILAMARALGETAPLLMIGMVAFVLDVPKSVVDVATVLPVQIYNWSGESDSGFVALTSGAIIVLLAFLIIMNISAVFLRKKLERRW